MEYDRRIPQGTQGLLERDLGDALVLMAEDGQDLHTLRGTGLFLWKALDGIRSVTDLARLLMAEYEVEEARAVQDTGVFFASLENLGLIRFRK